MSSACDNSACKQTLEQHKSAAKHYAEEAAELHAKYLAEISILREELEKKDEIITNLNRVLRHKDKTLQDAQYEARKVVNQSREHLDNTTCEARRLYIHSRELQHILGEGFESPSRVDRDSQYEDPQSPRSQDFSD